jgi:transcriptional regulator with XRE-family HTH domain
MRDDRQKQIKAMRLKGLPSDLREQIKQARTQRGLSQRELGRTVGLPQSHISAIESGEIVPRFDTLLDLVRVLDLDFLLVPRPLVPAVQSLVQAGQEPDSEERPLYAVAEDELASEREGSDES